MYFFSYNVYTYNIYIRWWDDTMQYVCENKEENDDMTFDHIHKGLWTDTPKDCPSMTEKEKIFKAVWRITNKVIFVQMVIARDA